MKKCKKCNGTGMIPPKNCKWFLPSNKKHDFETCTKCWGKGVR